jgi:hypothetical protein
MKIRTLVRAGLLLSGSGLAACTEGSAPGPADTGSMAYPMPVNGSGTVVPASAVPPTTGGMAIQQPGSGTVVGAPTTTSTGSMSYPPTSGAVDRRAQ